MSEGKSIGPDVRKLSDLDFTREYIDAVVERDIWHQEQLLKLLQQPHIVKKMQALPENLSLKLQTLTSRQTELPTIIFSGKSSILSVSFFAAALNINSGFHPKHLNMMLLGDQENKALYQDGVNPSSYPLPHLSPTGEQRRYIVVDDNASSKFKCSRMLNRAVSIYGFQPDQLHQIILSTNRNEWHPVLPYVTTEPVRIDDDDVDAQISVLIDDKDINYVMTHLSKNISSFIQQYLYNEIELYSLVRGSFKNGGTVRKVSVVREVDEKMKVVLENSQSVQKRNQYLKKIMTHVLSIVSVNFDEVVALASQTHPSDTFIGNYDTLSSILHV